MGGSRPPRPGEVEVGGVWCCTTSRGVGLATAAAGRVSSRMSRADTSPSEPSRCKLCMRITQQAGSEQQTGPKTSTSTTMQPQIGPKTTTRQPPLTSTMLLVSPQLTRKRRDQLNVRVRGSISHQQQVAAPHGAPHARCERAIRRGPVASPAPGPACQGQGVVGDAGAAQYGGQLAELSPHGAGGRDV